MDYDDREAKALEILNAPEAPAADTPKAPGGPIGASPGADGGSADVAAGGPPPAAGAAGVPGAPGLGDGPAAPASGAVGQPPAAQPVPGSSIPLWTGADPVGLNDLQQLMGSHHIGNMDQLKGTLADAGALYEVLEGRQSGASLLEAVRMNYPPQTFFRVLGEVRDYLQRFAPPPGFGASAGAGAASSPVGGNGNGSGAGAPDGVALRITQLENAWQAQQRQAEFQAQEQQRQLGFQAFMGRIRELGQKEGLDEDDIGNYAAAVAQRINGDPQVTGRLIQGKLNDVDRLFTEHHNSMLQWENRRNQKRLQLKQVKNDQQPRIATGGGPPAPVKPGKQDLSFEGRTARAMELLKQ